MFRFLFRSTLFQKRTSQFSIKIRIRNPENTLIECAAKSGESLLDVIEREAELKQYFECACGGNAACTTCAVVVDEQYYALLQPPEDYELDVLDLCYDQQKTTRLGCQLKFEELHDGIILNVPSGVNNLL